MNKTYTTKLTYSIDEDLMIELPDEIVDSLGWTNDDVLIWTDNFDGSFTIKKVDKITF